MENDILKAIQEGREVQTRNGSPVRIYATDGGGDYPIHGAYCIDKVWRAKTWAQDGRKYKGDIGLLDLIIKPKTIELDFWINVYPDGTSGRYSTRELADEWADDNRIACIHIKRTITEGEGL